VSIRAGRAALGRDDTELVPRAAKRISTRSRGERLQFAWIRSSATIEVSADQRVISTGPYRLVRHPMYAGGLLLVAATPLALGSLAALPLVLTLAILVARAAVEWAR
jgi:phospholipid methyltransferase